MDREEAIRRIKAWNLDSDDREVLAVVIPELAESEDERIRKELVAFFIEVRNREGNEGYWHDLKVANILAYLEKQKDLDKMIVVSPEVWDNAISDAFENGKREGEKQKEQKSTEWSEEDENARQNLIAHFEGKVLRLSDEAKKEAVDWLKSLRPVKQEWSEEDEERLKAICTYLQDYPRLAKINDVKRFNEYCDWLKSFFGLC